MFTMATTNIPTTEAPVTIRVRTLTSKGHYLYLSTVNNFDRKINLAKNRVIDLLNSGDHNNARDSFDIYSKVVSEYLNYLKGVQTAESEAQFTLVEEGYSAFRVSFRQMFSSLAPLLVSAKPEGGPFNHEPFIQIDSGPSLGLLAPADQSEPAVLNQGQSHLAKSKHLSIRSRTNASRRTGKTGSSHLSAIALEQRAQVEMARTKLRFANKEAQLLKEQAEQEAVRQKQEAVRQEQEAVRKKDEVELQGKLKVLEQQRELEVAEAKLKVYEEFSSEDSFGSNDSNSSQLQNARERTQAYVQQQQQLKCGKISTLDTFNALNPDSPEFYPHNIDLPNIEPPIKNVDSNLQPLNENTLPDLPPSSENVDPASRLFNKSTSPNPYPQSENVVPELQLFDENMYLDAQHPDRGISYTPLPSRTNLCPTVRPPNAHALPKAQHHSTSIHPNPSIPKQNVRDVNNTYHNPIHSDFTKFVMRKELSLSRLSKFDDNPEHYRVWKDGFSKVVEELEVCCEEEMDLLIKYLGPESRRWALNIRSSNVDNPGRGRDRIWARLDDRFASPEIIEASVKKRLEDFPKLTNKDNKRLFDLSDILSQIESLKESSLYRSLFSYFDTSSGVNPIVGKLPYSLQEKWTTKAMNYKSSHNVPYPPFTFFVKFVEDMAKMKNDPSFLYMNSTLERSIKNDKPMRADKPPFNSYNQIRVKKTEANINSTPKVSKGSVVNQVPNRNLNTSGIASKNASNNRHCIYHGSDAHTLNFCNKFRTLSLVERKDFLQGKGVCHRCCKSNDHSASDCNQPIKCGLCKATDHVAALHCESSKTKTSSAPAVVQHGGEKTIANTAYTHMHDQTHSQSTSSPAVVQHGGEKTTVSSKCTQVCGNPASMSKSCAKTFLVQVFPNDRPHASIWCYAILDDQSNCTLAKSKFFDIFGEQGPEIQYRLACCAGISNTSGRTTSGYTILSWDGSNETAIPLIVECDDIPNLRDEIPTPAVASRYPHLADVAKHIPPIDPNAEILLLIGRNVPSAHIVLDQRPGPNNAPFAQQTSLGWAVIGETCLNGVHIPPVVSASKTSFLPNGRPSLLQPCNHQFCVTEFDNALFKKTNKDEKLGLSVEDRQFLSIMDKGFDKDESGNWVAPLPFRHNVLKTCNNREHALHRMGSLHRSLLKNTEKKKHMVDFMAKVFDRGHAEVAPPLTPGEDCWYLPLFGVYHPKKPGKIRVVFDSSAKSQGVSLNDMLLTGPDLMNSLLGILLRFRQETVAVAADVEQMFHNFKVKEDHRNFLRFFWYKDNDPESELIEYRMTVHVFGNTPSPAIATYGLHRSIEQAPAEVRNFVENNFYVDDGLVSLPDENSARNLIEKTKSALYKGGKLRMHKIVSNNKSLLSHFAADELADNLKELDLTSESAPLQSSLGLSWDINHDKFVYRFYDLEKPFTKRGVLSVVNSLFDPLGFLAPIVIVGKLFLREVTSLKCDWDEPLPVRLYPEWVKWKNSLPQLERIDINHQYVNISLSCASRVELHIFSDASVEAIGAVSYLRVYREDRTSETSFILGKAKVAPQHGHTIPRLELCAAVMAVEVSETIVEYLDRKPDATYFYSDSNIVLGYIHNEKRRFHVYVSNRVDRIRQTTEPNQWSFVQTEINPADLATRGIEVKDLQCSSWLSGPFFLCNHIEQDQQFFPLVEPDKDKEVKALRNVDLSEEVKPLVVVNQNKLERSLEPLSHRFVKFSSWKRLIRAIALLKHIAVCFKKDSNDCLGWHMCNSHKTPSKLEESESLIIRAVQEDYFSREISKLQSCTALHASSPIESLSPYLDQYGVLRVGGRLSKGSAILDIPVKPIIIPKDSHIAMLLIRHFHESVQHQGRLVTEGAIRNGGFWILGGKRAISRVIHQCITCRKIRGKTSVQQMGDLPPDRIQPSPPFTYVGVDLFGPWHVTTRRTRGGSADSKRWGVLFTCLVSRAIHIEIVSELSTSCFINALKRFIAIRGPVKQIRSDRGTNFVGAVKELGIHSITDEGGSIHSLLAQQGCTWIFNPPHASHMGGAWERMIGVVRKILDVMLANHHSKHLTHEVLSTFFSEVCAIVNSRPIVPVSTDPEKPLVLSPAILLTQKIRSADLPPVNMDVKEAYKAQWRYVQLLSEEFWKKWQREYVNILQPKRKWTRSSPNLEVGNIVLLRTSDFPKGKWPLGIIKKTFPGEDGLVRKVEVRVVHDGRESCYVRPVTEVVHLV